MFLDSHLKVFTFLSWVDLLDVALAFRISVNRGRLLLRTPGPVPFGTCICSNVETILSWTCYVYGPFEFRTSLGTSILPFNSKNLQLTFKILTQGCRYHKLRKTFGKFFRSYSDLLSKFGEILFQEYVTEGISHPVFYGDLVFKLRRVRCEASFVSLGSKKRIRRRKYDPLIIEWTIGLVLGPSIVLYRSFLEHCTLTNKAMGTIWREVLKPSQRRQGPDPRPLWLLVGTPLDLGPELASRRAEHSHSGGCLNIFSISCFYDLTYLCNNFYDLSVLVGCWSSAFIRRNFFYKFLIVCPFDYTAFGVSGKVGIP